MNLHLDTNDVKTHTAMCRIALEAITRGTKSDRLYSGGSKANDQGNKPSPNRRTKITEHATDSTIK